jgi:ribosomal protein S24E
MKLKIVSKDQNPLIKRREVTFSVEHTETGGTPTRIEVRKQLAKVLKTNIDLVYIKQLETKTGTRISFGEANAYDSVEQAKRMEPKHIIARNMLPETSEESQVPKEETVNEEED